MRFPKRKTLLLAIRESWKLAWVYGIGLESGENREDNGYLKLEIGRNWKLFLICWFGEAIIY